MIENQEMRQVTSSELTKQVELMKKDNYRLVQIGCTSIAEIMEINYSFDKAYKFVNLKVIVPAKEHVIPSISGIYPNAFFYENEIHDLFGINIVNISIDYKGNFYRTSVKFPFNNSNQPT
ncbi:ech hydrogenase subunit D [Candidatus Omnitrophus magneticus]|uniref:Ech hydrogenase subunit D n=1 Tax=Candidatus Omnitrophus magneticus TaxID=1609969 RepID=A0A0F0CWM0_9BACT|nr:ech hydrogenase subunit D [Candidatus Omnitrophus magneticus]